MAAAEVAEGTPLGLINRGASDFLCCIVQLVAAVPELAARVLLFECPDQAAVVDAILDTDMRPPAATAAAAAAGAAGVTTGALQRLLARLVVGSAIGSGGVPGTTLLRPRPASLEGLTAAFGWGRNDIVRHDVNEMFSILAAAVDSEMAAFPLVLPGGVVEPPHPAAFTAPMTISMHRSIVCPAGHSKISDTSDFRISVPVARHESLARSLTDAVLAPETVDDYRCTQCDDSVAIQLATQIAALGPVLIFDLSRFDFSFETFETVKVLSRFEFPLVLDMAEFMTVDADADAPADAAASTIYHLAVVVCHTGTQRTGRYFAHVRVPGAAPGAEWWQVNDTTIVPSFLNDPTPGDLNEVYGDGVTNTVAYKLVYRRADAAADAIAAFKPNDLVSPRLYQSVFHADH